MKLATNKMSYHASSNKINSADEYYYVFVMFILKFMYLLKQFNDNIRMFTEVKRNA